MLKNSALTSPHQKVKVTKIIIFANIVLLAAGLFLGDVVLGGFGLSGLMFAANATGSNGDNTTFFQA